MQKKDFEINQNITYKNIRFKKGDVITLELDSNGIPSDTFWRARLRDSKVDNCLSLLSKVTKKNKK